MSQPTGSPPFALAIDPAALRELVREIVRQVVEELHAAEGTVGTKLAYGESEAAALLSLQPHQLRDLRLRGEIGASTGPNRTIMYTREDLVKFLAGRRWHRNGSDGQPGQGFDRGRGQSRRRAVSDLNSS
jgi:hypothetical protein